MTLTVHTDLLQGSDDWLAIRRGIVTASVIGQLITQSTLATASNDKSRALTALLVAERITGWTDPSYFNDDMQRGHDVEPIAREWYANNRGRNVEQVGFMVLERDGWKLGYSPDGLVDSDGLIEVKAPRAKTHLKTHVSGQVPINHLAQIHAGLFVSDREWCDFISYCGGMPPFVKRVHREQHWDAAIVQAVEQFEKDAAVMTAKYQDNTNGLPITDRLPADMEMSF